ncbi:MAG: fumarate reductase/succinate dehydrogenase flavoprotein subunit [SAR324 cluster bacterium]|jgi:succinate dehydrogenase / fumarate reductase flavoprotein subunit|nr:fumarate reductase/succinate dehydrogenase flavoprotein subunit [Deltaproteobacteria bacterium]MDP6092806.1 fumarate reductase/succinate dehydrogenase flavoprotein subunit [SAR324 cluster bacterium]MBP45501.1 fumarate reductase/succinate dehydrogenase flavoprotein subunit [Deltaproteobacteria bacterium]MDP7137953.1 fumarate reductase/succinate dehydrogenase flavoprotein subunit [SAR324 cluster bacterium]MDP7332273.1 fumarate reductase/succinate dehydrogenase flavoprotein subunit [SAR324 clus|tara:strand:- start:853 stop:2640 length:1788 start_codon:yes stop_codon:yes gene_type:complete
MDSFEIKEHDVLVIGAGGAGLRASIEASAQGVSVGLVCKSLLGKAHTVMAEGGMAASLRNADPRDNWEVHFRDTIRGGKHLNNWRMVEIFCQEAPERVAELEEWGALFDRTKEGLIAQRNFGGHRYPRLAHVGDRTGLELIRTLQNHGIHQGLDIYMECCIVDLILEDGKVTGAFGFWRESGNFIVFRAKSVILATGGLGKVYRVTSNSWEGTGDGHALAYRAGAELIDMEFVQFHPTGMVWPPSVQGILVTEGVRGEGGVLKNSEGQRFMYDYIPDAFAPETSDTEEEAERWLAGDPEARRPPELLTRDVVARAIRSERLAGRGSPHGGAFLDIASRRDAEYIKKKLPSMYHQFMKLGNLDITTTPMEVGPTCHYVMGGVRVDPETAMTTVEGLFAAGEAAGGMHGANRLGGNSLTDLLVFGARAGLHAAKHAREVKISSSAPREQLENLEQLCLDPFNPDRSENPYALMSDLQETMELHAGIVRARDEMEKGLELLGELKQRAEKVRVEGHRQYNPAWHYALDLRNLLCVAEAIALAALKREESRGGHTREDFPESSSDLQKVNAIIREENGIMVHEHREREAMPSHLEKLLN